MNDQKTKADVASRRHLLKLGAMAAPAVITLAPASARAAASVLNCRVPFPANIDSKGDACATPTSQTGTEGTGQGNGGDENICYEGPGEFLGQPEINELQGLALRQSPTIEEGEKRYQAYTNYLAKVRSQNQPGASCLMSIDVAAR